MSTYLDLGYSNLLSKTTQVDLSSGINSSNSEAVIASGSVGYGQTSLFKLNPGEDIQSENFSTGVIGWKIYGDGNAEFVGITLSGGVLKYGKTGFTDSTHAGYYFGPEGSYQGSAADASYIKYVIGTGVYTIKATIDGASTIGGRVASTLASAIDAAGHFADDAINTANGTILDSFTFGLSGALQIGVYEAGVTGDIRISPTGILGRDKNNATTFSINATTGVAVLNGLVVGTNVGIGTAVDSAGVTTIIGNTVTTGFVNALDITAEYVAASISITTPTITGGTFQTDAGATTGIKMDSTSLRGYDGANNTTFSLVRATGALTATLATITGAINATSGKFGTSTNYWSVGATGLTATSASTDVIINYGKTDFTNTQDGFILGYDFSASKGKFFIGNDTDYFNYNGANTIFRTTLADAITIDYGSNVLLKEGGNIKFTSLIAPTACTATLIATEIGNLTNGLYYYSITFVTSTGETELLTVSNGVTVDNSNKQIELSNIPISSSGAVIKRNIYRTKSGEAYYFLLATINNNLDTSYTDNTADADLTSAASNNKENDTFGKIIIDGRESLSIGFQNIYLGQGAGKNINNGYGNISIGTNSSWSNISGSFNTAIGYQALTYNTDSKNTAIGFLSLTTNSGGSSNTAVGYYSLSSNTDGVLNTSVGSSALLNNLDGYRNTAVGASALYTLTTGIHNTAIGQASLFTNSIGIGNTAIGSTSLFHSTGDYNTAVGSYALYTNSTGSSNVALGRYAGRYETGSNFLYIDNQDRTDIAGDKSKALIYGIFHATASNQSLTVNGNFILGVVAYKDINIAGYLLAKPASSAPGVDTFRSTGGTDTTIETLAFAIGEKVYGGFELQHDYKEGTNLVFHVHWQGIASPAGGTDNVQWKLTYIIARDGVTLAAAATINSPDTAINTQYRCYRTDFGAIDGTNFKIGDQFMFTLERVAASSDDYAGDCLIETAGIHYQCDTIGSKSISTK